MLLSFIKKNSLNINQNCVAFYKNYFFSDFDHHDVLYVAYDLKHGPGIAGRPYIVYSYNFRAV